LTEEPEAGDVDVEGFGLQVKRIKSLKVARKEWEKIISDIPPEEWLPPADIHIKNAYRHREPRLYGASSKILAYDRVLKQWLSENPNGRSLVFTQSLPTVSLIAEHLKRNDIPYLIYEGGVAQETRLAITNEFQTSEGTMVLICSYAAEVSINLTRATMVATMEPLWSPAKARQAVMRAHRRGQSQVCTWYKLFATNACIEKRAWLCQERKEELERNYKEKFGNKREKLSDLAKKVADSYDIDEWMADKPLVGSTTSTFDADGIFTEELKKYALEDAIVAAGRALPRDKIKKLFSKDDLDLIESSEDEAPPRKRIQKDDTSDENSHAHDDMDYDDDHLYNDDLYMGYASGEDHQAYYDDVDEV
jgi:superfamily II DNA or RNA helicase